MVTVVLTFIAGYIAIGIAVILTVNHAFVDRKSRLRSIGAAMPLVLAWPAVVFVLWAWEH